MLVCTYTVLIMYDQRYISNAWALGAFKVSFSKLRRWVVYYIRTSAAVTGIRCMPMAAAAA